MPGLTVLSAWRPAVTQSRWQVHCLDIRSTGSPRPVLAALTFGGSFSPVNVCCGPPLNVEQLQRYLIRYADFAIMPTWRREPLVTAA